MSVLLVANPCPYLETYTREFPMVMCMHVVVCSIRRGHLSGRVEACVYIPFHAPVYICVAGRTSLCGYLSASKRIYACVHIYVQGRNMWLCSYLLSPMAGDISQLTWYTTRSSLGWKLSQRACLESPKPLLLFHPSSKSIADALRLQPLQVFLEQKRNS